ncbi:glycosyltransferase [Paraburkholderia phymatum]|uniref:Glycosyl transferase family 2 n=1 Tax=Paraburkholderia phymatum (strain DSM 17167 / CIP 108236 / LMG 21445 / STM815) TaxID=391038 RepID=B2JMU1_PARP8|nr:glycosyltransferase [Paraburkholderia phymatum]ACC74334.1 glycosyl transferase family 2 [Paraburkholderia phymatum STM815]
MRTSHTCAPADAGSRITIVVLTHNRATRLIETLHRLRELPEYPQIIVADNASTDETVAMVDLAFPDVRIVQCGSNLGAAGRNRAVAHVETEYVAFCDDDTWWAPGSLAQAVRLLDASPQTGVLNARIEVGETGETDSTCVVMQHSPLDSRGLPGPSLIGYMAGASVFRTALFREAGGYDARLFIGGEEELLALDVLRRGYAIAYCEALTVAHHPSAARDSALRRRMLARNAAWIAWLRLPLSDALARTARAILTFHRERTLMTDGPRMLGGLSWAIRERRLVPRHVLSMLREVRQHERRADFTVPMRTASDVPSHRREQEYRETVGR